MIAIDKNLNALLAGNGNAYRLPDEITNLAAAIERVTDYSRDTSRAARAGWGRIDAARLVLSTDIEAAAKDNGEYPDGSNVEREIAE
jgi:hypothetical protein